MELIKENKEKQRSVFKLENGSIKKYWHNKDVNWLNAHIDILNKVNPGYVIDKGFDHLGIWAEFKHLTGFPAQFREHTPEFIKFIYYGCLKNLDDTAPFSHGDWVLSNIFINNDRLNFCDWDNVGIYNRESVMDKLHKDLYSAFGEKFYKVTGYDPSGF